MVDTVQEEELMAAMTDAFREAISDEMVERMMVETLEHPNNHPTKKGVEETIASTDGSKHGLDEKAASSEHSFANLEREMAVVMAEALSTVTVPDHFADALAASSMTHSIQHPRLTGIQHCTTDASCPLFAPTHFETCTLTDFDKVQIAKNEIEAEKAKEKKKRPKRAKVMKQGPVARHTPAKGRQPTSVRVNLSKEARRAFFQYRYNLQQNRKARHGKTLRNYLWGAYYQHLDSNVYVIEPGGPVDLEIHDAESHSTTLLRTYDVSSQTDLIGAIHALGASLDPQGNGRQGTGDLGRMHAFGIRKGTEAYAGNRSRRNLLLNLSRAFLREMERSCPDILEQIR